MSDPRAASSAPDAWPFRDHLTVAQADAVEAARAIAGTDQALLDALGARLTPEAWRRIEAYLQRNPRPSGASTPEGLRAAAPLGLSPGAAATESREGRDAG